MWVMAPISTSQSAPSTLRSSPSLSTCSSQPRSPRYCIRCFETASLARAMPFSIRCKLDLSCSCLLVEHDLLRKPVSTFRDHALGSSPRQTVRPFGADLGIELLARARHHGKRFAPRPRLAGVDHHPRVARIVAAVSHG